MEELSNLIWLGGAIAELGPSGFQCLWSFMHKFLKHYIYGADEHGREQKLAAMTALFTYAECLEQLVFQKSVCFPSCALEIAEPCSVSYCTTSVLLTLSLLA